MPKKRNWSVIALLALLVGSAALYLNYNQNQINVQTNQASVDYWLGNSGSSFFQNIPVYNSNPSATPDVSINCKNGGGMDGEFSLTVSFINATFSTLTQKPYGLTNSTCVVSSFILHKGESNSKLIYFIIDDGVSGFSISLSLQAYSSPLKPNAIYPCYVQYTWDKQNNDFAVSQ